MALALSLYANISCSVIRYFIPNDDDPRHKDQNDDFDCDIGEIYYIGVWCQEDCDSTTRGFDSEVISFPQFQVARAFSTAGLALLGLLECTMLVSLWCYIPKWYYRILGGFFLIAACCQGFVFLLLTAEQCNAYECDIHSGGRAVMGCIAFACFAALSCFIYAKGAEVEVRQTTPSKDPGQTSIMAIDTSLHECDEESNGFAPQLALETVKEETLVKSEL